MKKLFVGLLALMLLAGSSFALVDVNATYVSKYIWRGFDLNAGQPAVQPGLAFGFPLEGLSLGLWGSYNVGSVTKKEMTELDATLAYDGSAAGFDYSLGYTYYTFPNLTGAAAKSGEFFGGLTFTDVLFGPGLTVYYDHDQGNGLYAALAGGYDFKVSELGISSGLTLGYNSGQWGATAGISDISISLSSEFPVGVVSVAPSLNYVIIPEGTGVNPNSSEFWFGIDISGGV